MGEDILYNLLSLVLKIIDLFASLEGRGGWFEKKKKKGNKLK
jgi:hypothetical protein